MAHRHIIAVEPASGRGQTVVVEVHQDAGAQPLDVRLVGCEGESPYVTTIKQRNLGKLKQKFKGTDDEWTTVLSYFLLQTPPPRDQVKILEGVRLVYVLENDNLQLSIRQDIGDIKVTLGEITLPLDEEFEFNPFEWAQTSAVAHATTLKQLADLTTRANDEKDTIAKLDAQLQDFIRAKNEAETAMLQQFMQLLNEKKRKIRDQGRILADAKVDVNRATTVKASRTNTKSRKPAASRTSKRKAAAQSAEPDSKPQESDSDQMEIDQAKAEEEQADEEAQGRTTPDRSEDETESEEEVSAPRTTRTRQPASETVQSNSGAQKKKGAEEGGDSKGVPPPRSLPFGRPSTRSKDVAKKAASPVEDDGDDTTDEEEL
ncbi:hypothetical protein NX059_001820 [Plenodomus lindquistii]|nr:hypothetical protein NX059_001820 [Plenodomus lindquistii]